MRRVYFIKPIGMDGPIKIGCSQCPGKRLSSLETWCPFPLEIVAEIPGYSTLECRFHRKFLDTHLRSEWFAASAELTATIKQINAGSFDVETLPQYGGTLASLKSNKAEYSPLDMKYCALHHQFITLPYKAQWEARSEFTFSPSISAFIKLQPNTKVRHIAEISAALEKQAA